MQNMSDTHPVKRGPGRPRKHPIPTDAMSSLAGRTLGDPDASSEEKSLAAMVLASDPVEGPNAGQEGVQGVGNVDKAKPEPRRRGKGDPVAFVAGSPAPAPEQVKALGSLELEALKREAWEAFDYQQSRGKTDSLGRIWGFEPEVRNNHTVVTFTLKRPCGQPVERSLSTSQYATEGARRTSDALVEEMNGLLE